MHRLGVMIAALVVATAGMLGGCAASIEGAWEGKVEHPQGSDPSGFEVHLTLSRFLKGEPSGAIEYTIFHPTQETNTCKATLKATSKAGGVYEYEEAITQGKCVTDMTIRVTSGGPDNLKWERIDADGGVDMAATLGVQTGVATAKDRAGG